MKKAHQINEICLLKYPDVLLGAVHGLTDLFQIASRFGGKRSLRVSHWQLPAKSAGRVMRVYDSHPRTGKDPPSVVIVPPSLGEPFAAADAAKLTGWITALHAHGAIICSICSGAFVLAESGLLSGRVATTHWTYAHEFGRRFPEIQVDTDRLIIDDGDIVTAGGLMAWMDLGLRIVERLLGTAVMVETARFMVLDPPGREQSYYRSFIPVLTHGDEAILKVQRWLPGQIAQQTDIRAMASRAGLEERTFLRRFHKSTGLKPTAYSQHLRIERARAALESTNRNIDEIAWTVGYEDAGAFRKVFHRILGLTPGEYRSRFHGGRGM